MGGWTAPWNSTPISTPEPCFSRSALKRSTTSSTNFWPSLYLNGARCVAAQLHLHRVHAGLGADGPVDADSVAGRAAEQVVDRHAEHLALDVPERHVDAARDRRLDRAAAIEGAAMDRLPVVHDPRRILADQVVADFQRPGGAGLGVVLQHLAPAGDPGVGRDLDEHPGVREHEGLELGDLDLVLRPHLRGIRARGRRGHPARAARPRPASHEGKSADRLTWWT